MEYRRQIDELAVRFSPEERGDRRSFEDLIQHSHIFLLPLLEFPPQAVRTHFRGAFLRAGIAESSLSDVSFERLICTALEFGSKHWSALAIEWLDSGVDITPAICESLLRAAEMQQHTQQVRHAAVRAARRWQRARKAT